MSADRSSIAGLAVDAVDLAGAADAIVTLARAGASGATVCLANAWTCVCADREPAVAAAVGRASLVVPDGVPLVRALWRAGHRAAGKVTGIELVPEVARRGLASDLAHYVYGGAPGVAERAAAGIRVRVPAARVVGSSAPPVADVHVLLREPLERLREDLERTRPDVLWVGLGTPKQEVWMAAAAARLPVPVMVGVGAALGYLAGDRRPAPRLLRHGGGEWLWRLVAEPRRLWRRYLLGNLRFLRLRRTSGAQ